MNSRSAVTLLASESFTVSSTITGKAYKISVALPYTYEPDGLPGGPFSTSLPAWPVVYLTDANWHFGMVTDFVRETAWCGRTTGAIVVGIGYAESSSAQETWRNVSELRANDLTQTHSDKDDAADSGWLNRPVTTGGGGRFLASLKQELVPRIETEYRADPTRRVLVGHSYGGSFVLYALLQEPGLFRSYVAASPYLRGGDGSLFSFESEFASTHQDLNAQLYLAAGELEESAEDTTRSDMDRFAAQLATRNYPGLAITQQIFADCNHCEVVAPALHAGLKLALKR